MIDNIGGVTSQLVRVALDAALLRHEIIANNIANADTPGFQAKRLDFEQQLVGFSALLSGGNDDALTDRINSLKASLHESDSMVVSQQEPVELDREMIRLTENTLRYQALLQASSKRGDIIKMAVREGRQ